MHTIADLSWSNVPGSAIQVVASPDGSIWALGTSSGTDKPVWHYADGSWTNIPGSGTQLAVSPTGGLYIVNSAGAVYTWNGSSWTSIGGAASAITIAADGSVYVLSTGTGDRAIWHLVDGSWTELPGSGAVIAASWDTGTYYTAGGQVAPSGFYVLNSAGNIYYGSSSGSYVGFPGSASAVAPTTVGGFFVLTYPADPSDGNSIYYYNLNRRNQGWSGQGGTATDISAGNTTLWVVNTAGEIYYAPIATVSNPSGATGASGSGCVLNGSPYYPTGGGVTCYMAPGSTVSVPLSDSPYLNPPLSFTCSQSTWSVGYEDGGESYSGLTESISSEDGAGEDCSRVDNVTITLSRSSDSPSAGGQGSLLTIVTGWGTFVLGCASPCSPTTDTNGESLDAISVVEGPLATPTPCPTSSPGDDLVRARRIIRTEASGGVNNGYCPSPSPSPGGGGGEGGGGGATPTPSPGLVISDLLISGSGSAQIVSVPAQPASVLVGQQVQLEAQSVPSSLGTPTDVQYWFDQTDPSQVVLEYSPAPHATTSPEPLTQAQLFQSSATPLPFYWVAPGVKHVHVSAMVAGQSVSADVYYPVWAPHPQVTTTTIGDTAVGAYWFAPYPTNYWSACSSTSFSQTEALYFGNQCIPHGIDWLYQVTGVNSGSIAMVQLVDSTLNSTRVGETPMPTASTNGYVLDGNFPYGNVANPTPAPVSATVVSMDAPYDTLGLRAIGDLAVPYCTSTEREDQFKDYFMYLAPRRGGVDSVWVALGSLSWQWGGKTLYDSGADTWGSPSPSNGSPTSLSLAESSVLPTWLDNVNNFVVETTQYDCTSVQ